MTARENVIVGALARPGAIPAWRAWTRLYPAGLRHEANNALAALGLAERADTRADQLSGGERQKVGIGRLLLQRPRLILADEPTSALDPAATGQACAALRNAAGGGTLITVVHDTSLLPLLADRVIALADGRVVFDKPCSGLAADDLAGLYAGPEAAQRIGCKGFARRTVYSNEGVARYETVYLDADWRALRRDFSPGGERY